MATQPTVIEPEIDKETGKFVYSYQPRDSEGQFIGKPYRFLYTDQQDLIKQITDAKENGDRFIHEVKTGKRKLQGEPATPQPDYKPVAAANEDDAKRREQVRKDLEAELGAPLETAREDLKRARMLDEYLLGQRWAMENEANGYYTCPQNAKQIYAYIKEKNLAFTASNLDLAFEELKDKLTEKPQEITADSTQQQPPTKVDARPQSTGIIPGQFQGTRQPNRQEKLPLTRERFRQIDKMSRDEWKKLWRTNQKEAEAFNTMKFGTAQPQQ